MWFKSHPEAMSTLKLMAHDKHFYHISGIQSGVTDDGKDSDS